MDTNDSDQTDTRRRSNRPATVNPHDDPITIDEVISELEYLLGTDNAITLAKRLGYSNHRSLTRALERADRFDLAHALARTVPLSSDGDLAANQLGLPVPVPLSIARPSSRRRKVAA